jgi:potassium channel subfamily K, other eukaryote
MGNTVVEEIRGLTLWIGNFTIFPGKGFGITFKRAVRKATKGRVFHNNIEETPSDVLNHTNHRTQQPHSLEQESRSVKGALLSPCVPLEREAGGSEFKHLPTRRKDRHCLLITEIMMVMRHANSSPKKKKKDIYLVNGNGI